MKRRKLKDWADWELRVAKDLGHLDHDVLQLLLPGRQSAEIVSKTMIADQLQEEYALDEHVVTGPPNYQSVTHNIKGRWPHHKKEPEPEPEQSTKLEQVRSQIEETARFEVHKGTFTCAYCYGNPDGCPECDHGYLHDPVYDRRTGDYRFIHG